LRAFNTFLPLFSALNISRQKDNQKCPSKKFLWSLFIYSKWTNYLHIGTSLYFYRIPTLLTYQVSHWNCGEGRNSNITNTFSKRICRLNAFLLQEWCSQGCENIYYRQTHRRTIHTCICICVHLCTCTYVCFVHICLLLPIN
jgi:hypothetical protein